MDLSLHCHVRAVTMSTRLSAVYLPLKEMSVSQCLLRVQKILFLARERLIASLACVTSCKCRDYRTWARSLCGVQGHKIKNAKTVIAQQLRRIPVAISVIISGTPIQNNLMELHALFDFVCPVRPPTCTQQGNVRVMQNGQGGLGSAVLYISTSASVLSIAYQPCMYWTDGIGKGHDIPCQCWVC